MSDNVVHPILQAGTILGNGFSGGKLVYFVEQALYYEAVLDGGSWKDTQNPRNLVSSTFLPSSSEMAWAALHSSIVYII
jgi:hypothetical protein